MSTSTITKAPVYTDVLAALRDVHDEASLWKLSDELVKIAPTGVKPVQAVVSEAKKAGVPTKSTNTLRLYRDVAKNFPASERVPGVTFSAHREALGGFNGDTAKAKGVLVDLVKQHGAAGVTVTTVKKAIAVSTGNVPAAKAAAKGAKPVPSVPGMGWDTFFLDVATSNGATFLSLTDAIMASTPAVTLDGLHAGLTTMLGQIEVRRGKAARKAAQAKNPAPAPAAKRAPAPSGKATTTAGKGKAGDIRGL